MDARDEQLVIPTWANGPDGSGNGGWSAGLLAEHADHATAMAVSLRVPPPLGRALQIVPLGQDRFELRDGELLIADAAPTEIDRHVPRAVRELTRKQAHAARDGFPFRDSHPFPRCLVCGTARTDGQPAFHLHCGPVDGLDVDGAPVFADAWTPDPSLHDPTRPDDPEAISAVACWAALDCPSAAPVADPDAEYPIVLARIAAWIQREAFVGEPLLTAAWQVREDGRKHFTRSVLLREGGEVLGIADALWIEVRPR